MKKYLLLVLAVVGISAASAQHRQTADTTINNFIRANGDSTIKFLNPIEFPDGSMMSTASSNYQGSAIVYADSAGTATSDSANLFWNATNKWLGIGTNVPNGPLNIAGYMYVQGFGNYGNGRQLLFMDTAEWISNNPVTNTSEANNFHIFDASTNPWRGELESNGELQFYLEGGTGYDAWIGFQEGANHYWSMGQDASNSGAFRLNQAFGLGSTPSFLIERTGNTLFSPQFPLGIGGKVTFKFDSVSNMFNHTSPKWIYQSAEDGNIQIVSNYTGSVGNAIILSTQVSSSASRNFTIQHRGPTDNGFLRFTFYGATANSQNLLTGGKNILSFDTSGGVYVHNTPESTSGTDSIVTINSSDQLGAMAFSQGVYLPNDSSNTNMDAITLDSAFYVRIGNIVTVSGVVTIDPTSTGTTSSYINIPVSFVTHSSAHVSGSLQSGSVNESGSIISGTTQRVLVSYQATSTASNVFSYSFTYRIQ